MSEIITPRRVAHFEDPRLERQFDAIVAFSEQMAEEVERVKEVSPDSDFVPGENQPSTPMSLTVHSAFKKFIISWGRLSSTDVAGYIVAHSSSFDDESTWNEWIEKDVGNTGFFIHENLDPAYDYRYKVAAYSINGIRSGWTDIVIAGNPGKISLSEDVTGELISDYLADGTITEDKFDTTVVEKYIHVDETSGNISVIGKSADEISSTVAEVYTGGAISGSTIQQNANDINLRVVALDAEGNPTSVNAQLNISQVDGDGYVYIGGDQITIDGDTNVDGNLDLAGYAVINGSLDVNVANGNIKLDEGGIRGNYGSYATKQYSTEDDWDLVLGSYSSDISGVYAEVDTTEYYTNSASLHFYSDGTSDSGGYSKVIIAGVDLSNESTITFRYQGDYLNRDYFEPYIKIDGTEVWSNTSDKSYFDAQSIDVSGYNYNHTIEIGIYNQFAGTFAATREFWIDYMRFSTKETVFAITEAGDAIFKGTLEAVNGVFSGSLRTPDLKAYQSAHGGIIEMYHGQGDEKIVHLGNRRDYEGTNDAGTLVLSGEDGIGKSAISVNDSSGYGHIILGNSEINTEPLVYLEGLFLRGGKKVEGDNITLRRGMDYNTSNSIIIDAGRDTTFANQEGRIAVYNNDGSGVAAVIYGNYDDTGKSRMVADLGYFDTIEADTKNFRIPHPEPGKEAYYLKHGAVETNTAGDNLYRYEIEVDESLEKEFDLPSYFKYLNGKPDVWVTPFEHFGSGYGIINGNKLHLFCNQEGKYKVLVIGTRKDEAVQNWTGTEVHYIEQGDLADAYERNYDMDNEKKRREKAKKIKQEFKR